jgi:hypothetical protein
MQTILGANGVIGRELSRRLPQYADRIRQVSRSPKPVNTTDELFTADLLDAKATGCGPLATVLGVRPAEPAFTTVRIEPHLGRLQRAEGRVPHPLGIIEVRLVRSGVSGLRAEITLPPGLEGVLAWPGKETALRPDRQQLSF